MGEISNIEKKALRLAKKLYGDDAWINTCYYGTTRPKCYDLHFNGEIVISAETLSNLIYEIEFRLETRGD